MGEREKNIVPIDLNQLDAAARANLRPSDLDEYFRYKNQLIEEKEPLDSIKDILTGFIWDCTEEYD